MLHLDNEYTAPLIKEVVSHGTYDRLIAPAIERIDKKHTHRYAQDGAIKVSPTASHSANCRKVVLGWTLL